MSTDSSSSSPHHTRPRRLRKKLLLLLFSLTLTLIAVEGVLRLLNVVPTYGYPQGLFRNDPVTGFRFTADFGPAELVKQEFITDISTNSQGFRDKEWPEADEGGWRILSVGDSFVWGGYGTAVEETYSALLEDSLQEDGTEAHVLNAGVVAWGTDNQLDYYRGYGEEAAPDVVLLSVCVANDFFDNLERDELTVEDGYLVSANAAKPSSLIGSVRNFLMAHSRVYMLAERSATSLPGISSLMRTLAMNQGELLLHDKDKMQALASLADDPDSDLAMETKRLLDELHALTLERGDQLVVFAVPAQFQVDPNTLEFVRESYGLEANELAGPQTWLADYCRERDIPYIDPLQEFRELSKEQALYWEFNPHFNAAGNQLSAEALFEGMRNLAPDGS